MQNIKLMCLTIGLLAIIANDSIFARGSGSGGGSGHSGSSHSHGHSHIGISVGGYYGPGFYGYGGYGYGGYGYGYPYYYPPFYYPPAYAYPPTVIAPSAPPVYIQQEQPQPIQPQSNYWYYCQDPEGYYPYVKNCPGGWQPVSPQPPAQ
jgi:hypothetical protein